MQNPINERKKIEWKTEMQIVIPRNEKFGKFVLFATEEAILEHVLMYENTVQWKTKTK